MRRVEYAAKKSTPSVVPPRPHISSLEVAQLQTMTTDELVKLLMSPELEQPANAAVRQQVITLLQEREGNDFVRRVLGLPPGEEVS